MKRPLALLTTALAALLTLSSCTTRDQGLDGFPLLSLLTNQRMMLILKGTYATDDPLGFDEINQNQIFRNKNHVGHNDYILDGIPSYNDLGIFIDIGEVRLSTKLFIPDPNISALWTISSPKKSEEFWDVLSYKRQVYCSRPYSTIPEFDSCRDTGGIINYIEFFNGRGAVYPSRDVGPGFYTHAGVFIRAFVTGYNRATDPDQVQPARFDNNDIHGAYNILPWVQYDPGSNEGEQAMLSPQFFPLHHQTTWGQQGTLYVDNSTLPAVVEIRSNLKENMMLHRMNMNNYSRTVVGFSDWRRSHEAGHRDMGGNVRTRGRIFYPDFVTDLYISGGQASQDPDSDRHFSRFYYAVYIENECVSPSNSTDCNKDQDFLPLAAVPVRKAENRIISLMAGPYELQCRYDSDHNGYPDRVVSRRNIDVPVGPAHLRIDFLCGNSTGG